MRNQDHPGVSVVPGHKPSYPYHLSFKHPLLKGKQIKRSCKTTDGAQAAKFAIELSNILRNPSVWLKLPDPKSVRAIWNGDVIDEALLRDLENARPKGYYGDYYKLDALKAEHHEKLTGPQKNFWKRIGAFTKQTRSSRQKLITSQHC